MKSELKSSAVNYAMLRAQNSNIFIFDLHWGVLDCWCISFEEKFSRLFSCLSKSILIYLEKVQLPWLSVKVT